MMLSKHSIEAISDLIENRLAMMTVSDQDDLRDRMILQRALNELRKDDDASIGVLQEFTEIPRRGRRRKIAGMVGE